MKIFNKILMESENSVNLLKDCYFQAAGVDAAVEDGALVVIGDLRAHELYSTMKDLNARNCKAYATTDTYPVFGFVDYVGVSHADVMGVQYKIGEKLAGVAPVAGEGTRVRMLHEGDEFYLGNENFNGTPAVGSFAIPEADKTTVKVVAAGDAGLATAKVILAIEDTRDLIMGQVNEGSTLYRCRVISC